MRSSGAVASDTEQWKVGRLLRGRLVGCADIHPAGDPGGVACRTSLVAGGDSEWPGGEQVAATRNRCAKLALEAKVAVAVRFPPCIEGGKWSAAGIRGETAGLAARQVARTQWQRAVSFREQTSTDVRALRRVNLRFEIDDAPQLFGCRRRGGLLMDQDRADGLIPQPRLPRIRHEIGSFRPGNHVLEVRRDAGTPVDRDGRLGAFESISRAGVAP